MMEWPIQDWEKSNGERTLKEHLVHFFDGFEPPQTMTRAESNAELERLLEQFKTVANKFRERMMWAMHHQEPSLKNWPNPFSKTYSTSVWYSSFKYDVEKAVGFMELMVRFVKENDTFPEWSKLPCDRK